MLKIIDPKNGYRCTFAFTKYISATWTKRFYSTGSFTIILPDNAEGLKYLQKNKLILHNGYSGIIKYRSSSKGRVELRGYDLKGLCRQRMVVPPFVYMENPTVESGYDRIRGTPEEVIRHYVNEHMVNPSDTARKFTALSLAEKHGYTGELVWQAKFTNLADELESICKYSDLGYDITFDETNGKMFFDVLKPSDRASTDTHYGQTVFYEGYHNVSNVTYTEDALDETNVCFVEGDGDDEQQFIYEAYNSEVSDIARSESCTTASGSDSDYADEVQSKGLAYINENKAKESIGANVNSRLKYGTDWALGDFVTVVANNCFGERLSLKKQITEVTEVFEHSSHAITPVFGEKNGGVIKRF